MKTRRITNKTLDHSAGLCDEGGAPLVGVPITFILCNQKGEPSDAWDITTGGLVITSEKTVPTDQYGEFEMDLWPTGLGTGVYYMCKVGIADAPRYFLAPLDFSESNEDISWFDWQRAGKVLVPTGIFTQHIQDSVAHLSVEQHAAMESASNPSADNPFATMQDVPAGAKDVIFEDQGKRCRLKISYGGTDDNDKDIWYSEFETVP